MSQSITHLQTHIKKINFVWKPLGILQNLEDCGRFYLGDINLSDNGQMLLTLNKDHEEYKKAIKKGLDIELIFNVERDTTHNVTDFFLRRMTSRKRTDFDIYLDMYGLKNSDRNKISDFTLLSYTEAKLPSDGFHAINDYSMAQPPLEFVTEVFYMNALEYSAERIHQMNLGDSVTLKHDDSNIYDESAIKIIDQAGDRVGYLNHIQSPSICKWLQDSTLDVRATIHRINGTPIHPRLFIFIEVIKK